MNDPDLPGPAARCPLAARTSLREATRAAHASVDGMFSHFDLANDAGYRRFLRGQAAAHLPIEAALDAAGASAIVPDWTARRRASLLLADLNDLGITPAPAIRPPAFASAAAVAGGAYVLEGSRLGGAMLRRTVAAGSPTRFLDAPAEPGAWRALLVALDPVLADPADLAVAVAAARSVFAAFETAGRHELGTAHG